MLICKSCPQMPHVLLLAARRTARTPTISSVAYRHFSPTTSWSSSTSTSFENHTLNCSKAVMKADEGRLFSDLMNDPVSTLEGIGPDRTEALEFLGIYTIGDVAKYKYFHVARAIATMAKTEIAGDRPIESIMNIDQGVDKEYETKSFKEIVEAPVSALLGIGEKKSEAWKHVGVITVGDLANSKYCHWAESIVVLSGCEGKIAQPVDEADDTSTASESSSPMEGDDEKK